MILRDDQTDFIGRVQTSWRQTRHVLGQANCGWGKTHIIAEASRRAWTRGRRVLVLAHRRRLIQQISARLEQFGVPHGVIMANPTDDLKARHTSGALVQVASRDTLISRLDREGLPVADLVIPDEAHNLLGDGYHRLMQHYDAAYWLGLTATPVTGDGRGLGRLFGELVCAPPISQLIASGVVVPFRVYAAVELAEARKSGGAIKPAGDPVQQWKRHADGRPTVLFAQNVAASQRIVEMYLRAGIPAAHIDAHSKEDERESASERLESGELKVVSQVGLWTEGVDVPCLGCVQLMTKCGSLVKYIQATQRAGRAYSGKDFAVVIDHTGAVFDHGFPDEDIEWELSDGAPKKASEGGDGGEGGGGGDREPSICTKCGLAYAGGLSCPACGNTLAFNRKMYQPDLFAHLVEIDRETTAAVKAEAPQRTWERLRRSFAHAGKKVKQLRATFRGQFGMWPEAAGVSPIVGYDENEMLVRDIWPELVAKKVKVSAGPGLFGGDE